MFPIGFAAHNVYRSPGITFQAGAFMLSAKVQTIEFDLTFARFVPNPSEGINL